MKLYCPDCSKLVAASNISLETGWAKCDACQELIDLVEVVPGFSPPGTSAARPVERPFNARALVERSARELLVHIPAEGMRAATCGLLGFATFWLAFIAFWTSGALGLFGGQPPGAFNWAFASFSIPFWLVGFGMMAGVAWKVWGTKSVRVDLDGMTMHQRCLLWSRTRWVERDRVQHARHYEPKVQGSGQEEHGVEIVFRAGSYVLPTDSDEEEQWLITEINGFISPEAA